MTEVPKAALDWLFGDGPDPDGKWFGECEDAVKPLAGKFPRRYWWRTKFRAMIKDATATTQPQSLTGCQIWDAANCADPRACRVYGFCVGPPSCIYIGKELPTRRTVEAQVDGIVYPRK